MNQRQNSSHHKRAVREARLAKLLFAFIAIASLAIVIFILNIPSIINNENKLLTKKCIYKSAKFFNRFRR